MVMLTCKSHYEYWNPSILILEPMQKTTLDFPHNSRITYTAVKNLFNKQTGFSSVKCNDELLVIEARHGAWLSPFSENVKIKVAATSGETCRMVVESSSRSILNLLNFGANTMWYLHSHFVCDKLFMSILDYLLWFYFGWRTVSNSITGGFLL